MKILLIDDDPFSLKLLTQQLKALGHTDVTTHERAHDAVAELRHQANAFDLISCDLQMPEMDGIEFLRHLVGLSYAGGLILISGEDIRILQSAQQLAESHKLNVLGALNKPITPEQLHQVLQSYKPRNIESIRSTNAITKDELLGALSRQEIINHYQPKVEVATGKVVGVEALVRWQHPKHGLIFPDQFITLAEEQGLINALTRTVLVEALQQTARWHVAGLNLCVSVNVSMDNLSMLDFPDYVAEEATKAGVPLSKLILEITESRVMRAPTVAMDILTRLRLKNIGLSIDDFGTGHSSLIQLSDIPFDELKIDRGFVHGIATHATHKAIYEASISMARKLGLKTVAEGVEDRSDWDCVSDSDCNLAQGYFVGRPMPALDLVGWISDWQSRYIELTVPASVRSNLDQGDVDISLKSRSREAQHILDEQLVAGN